MWVPVRLSIATFALFIKVVCVSEELKFGNVTFTHETFQEVADRCAKEDCKELSEKAKKYQQGEEECNNILEFGQALEKCLGLCAIRRAYEERNLTDPGATEEEKLAIYEQAYEEKHKTIARCQLGACKELSLKTYTCILAPAKGCTDSINTGLDYAKCISDCVDKLEGKKQPLPKGQPSKDGALVKEETTTEERKKPNKEL